MFNVNLLKSSKIKVVSIMLSLAFIFLSIPTFPTKAASDFEHIQASTEDTYITASNCEHTYSFITSFQVPGISSDYIHNGQLCNVTVVYNIIVFVCTNCGHMLNVVSSVYEIHSVAN